MLSTLSQRCIFAHSIYALHTPCTFSTQRFPLTYHTPSTPHTARTWLSIDFLSNRCNFKVLILLVKACGCQLSFRSYNFRKTRCIIINLMKKDHIMRKAKSYTQFVYINRNNLQVPDFLPKN